MKVMNYANLGDWAVFLINEFSHSASIYIACSVPFISTACSHRTSAIAL